MALTYYKTKVLTLKAICVDRAKFILNAQGMYIKSEEEIMGVLQVLPTVFKERYGQDLDLNALKAYLKEVLEKEQRQTIERQFSGWNVQSIIAMLNVLETPVSKTKPDTSVEQPITPNRKGKKKNG